MNQRKQDGANPDLEALYRETGDAEPEPGLDRTIRARADEAIRRQGWPGRSPWLGGLVTASVAIVAVAVVLQQSPPSEPMPEAVAPLELEEPEAFMAPSVGARPEQKSSRDAGSAASDDSARAGSALTRSASPAGSQSEAAPESNRAEQRREAAGEESRRTGERARQAPEPIAQDPANMVEEIRELLEKDKTAEAQELLQQLREAHPDHAVPEDIEKALIEKAFGPPE